MLKQTVLDTFSESTLLEINFFHKCCLAVAYVPNDTKQYQQISLGHQLHHCRSKADSAFCLSGTALIWTSEPWHTVLALLIWCGVSLWSGAGTPSTPPLHFEKWGCTGAPGSLGCGITCLWVRPEGCWLQGVTRSPLPLLPLAPSGDPTPLYS